jgi:Arc/MetJ-type ribon-helix-helix transcriptional regulator
MHYSDRMKTAVLPQVRVEPELRADLESVLREGESLSEFVEASVRGAVEYRRAQAEFHERGRAAWQEYQRTGVSYPADEVIAEMGEKLEARRRALRDKGRAR